MGEQVKHTPGPWVVIPPEPYDGDEPEFEGSFVYPGGIEGADGNPVCTFGWSGGSGSMFENAANPHLIAAAPDLLAACQKALGVMTGNMDGDWDIEGDPRDLLRAALAKARGQEAGGERG